MAWDGRHPKLGFTSGTPWLPVAESHRSLAVAQQVGRPHGTLEIVKSLIKTRKDHPALGLGSISFEDFPDPILAFTRTYESEKIFCAFNVSSEPALVNWSKLAVATQIIGHGILYTNNETIELAPYGFIFAEAENA
jgi:alpha-glucosidase